MVFNDLEILYFIFKSFLFGFIYNLESFNIIDFTWFSIWKGKSKENILCIFNGKINSENNNWVNRRHVILVARIIFRIPRSVTR